MTASNLKELISQQDHQGFKLAVGHCVILKHGLMGTFPAIESVSKEMVMTTDFELLKDVCKILTPRQYRFMTQLLYVNSETGIAYSILDTDESALEKATPFQTLTREHFEKLMKTKDPFKWAPGLVGNDMSKKEFLETLEAAMTNA